jgi:uncharacterized membrane protein
MGLERGDLRRGFELIRQGRLEDARAFFQQALRVDPADIDARFGMGCVYAALGDRDRAVEEWRRCLDVDPEMGEAHYALAWAHYDAGDYERGFRHVESAHRSGVPLELLREISGRFVRTGKPLLEREERPTVEKEVFYPLPGWLIHVACCVALSIVCYLLLQGTLREGYPHYHLDATVAFYIAKLKMLLTNGFKLYTPVWYFGYELLRFYPPLSTLIPYMVVRLTGNLLSTYYALCFIYYTLYVLGVYLFASRFLSSQMAGLLAAFLWSITHVNFVSFQGHYWETARLMGTALVPWTLYFADRALAEGQKRDVIASICLASYVLLSSMLSALDLMLLLIPFLFIRGGLAPPDPEPQRYFTHERMGRLLLWGIQGILGLTLWWYIPALLPHGVGTFLSVGRGRPPPLIDVLFRLRPPGWMPSIQLPITLLGLIGAISVLILRDRRGTVFSVWFLLTSALVYIIGIQSVRLILGIGFSLVLLSAFFIKTLEEQIEVSRRGMGKWVSLLVSLLVAGCSLYIYLPTYSSYALVDDAYEWTDEYLTATWLAGHVNSSYRVYVMYGDYYRGTQWLNTFEPEVRQVLGGFDQGGRAMSLEPFEFDYLIKWSVDSMEVYKKAIVYSVKYIVIDKGWMLRNSPIAYEKFKDVRYFKAVKSINDELKYAEVYEVINVPQLREEKTKYIYWNSWRILGLTLTALFIPYFIYSITRTIIRRKIRKIETIEIREIKVDKILDVFMYLIACGLTLLIILRGGALIGFPRGCDAYVHLYKTKYIIDFYPNFHWNYQWDCGVPIFGGIYPPISYYIFAFLTILTKSSIENILNISSTISRILMTIGIIFLVYNLTKSRIISILCISLLIFTPAYWIYWFISGTYGRLISMGFMGLSLFLYTLIYIKNIKHPIILFIYPIIITLTLTSHLIGYITIILIFGFILFRKTSLIQSIKEIAQNIAILIPLNAFYIFQYFFSNPHRGRRMLEMIAFKPAKISSLIYTASYQDLHPLIVPLVVIVTILNLLIRRRSLVHNKIKPALITSMILLIIFLLYAYIGHIPHYPSLYIPGFLPENALGIVSIWGSLYIAFSICYIMNHMNDKNKNRLKYIILFIIFMTLLIGIIFELPTIKADKFLFKFHSGEIYTPPLLSIIKIDVDDFHHRVAVGDASIAIWFNYFYDVPQTRDYFGEGAPYINWRYWFEHTVWGDSTDDEMVFLLDWFAVKWILTDRNINKFLNRENLYHLVAKNKNWYEFEYLNNSQILSPTNVPLILFIGSENNYDIFLRVLSLNGLGSDRCIPIRGRSLYVDSYPLEELRRFSAIVLYGYKYRSLTKMSELLSNYVARGGCLFLEANGSPDYESTQLPAPFPIEETYTYSIIESWGLIALDHPITQDINFSRFSPPLYGTMPWGVSTTSKVAEWADAIVKSGGCPLIVAGEYGNGRVVWSGMNLFYHTIDYRNPEEARFAGRILQWLRGIDKRPSPHHQASFINPQLRIIELDAPAKGILFKENHFPQWHAFLVSDGVKKKLKIYLAGPGMMYIPLPEIEGPSKVTLKYELSLQEKVGCIISYLSLIPLLIIAFKKPQWLYPIETQSDVD